MSDNPLFGPDSPVALAAKKVAEENEADVLLYNGDIEFPHVRKFVKLCRERERRKNVILILVTRGGDPDSAYRMARCLQSLYERFEMYVSGYCKSAGTLVALGAHALVFGADGELGPLDVQMSKQDSWDPQSGLTVNAALAALKSRAYLAFEEFFLETEERSQGLISIKTAGEIATNLTIGLFAPLYSQVDPLHVGEATRAMQIGDQYGMRLLATSENADPGALRHLTTHYPSHGFVIDEEEARTIFARVRDPSEAEIELAHALEDTALDPGRQRDPIIDFLSEPPESLSATQENLPQTPPGPIAGLADQSLPMENSDG